MEITDFSQLDLSKTYTYADYLLWKFKERVEVLRGRIFKMSPAPARIHQKVSLNVTRIFDRYFQGNPCELYVAPFDVRLPNKNGEILSVVQPDLCVVCDLSKLDDKGCNGAPDLIVEILSPGNTRKEMDYKFSIYEESGVSEYWIVHPTDRYVQIFFLENGIYTAHKPFTEGQAITSKKFPELSVNADEIFHNLD